MLIASQLDSKAQRPSLSASVIVKDGKVIQDRKPPINLAGQQEGHQASIDIKYIKHTSPRSGYLTCCRCGHNRRMADFYPSVKSTTGYRRRCKECESELATARYAKRKALKEAGQQGFDTWWLANSKEVRCKGKLVRLFAGLLPEQDAKRIWISAEDRIIREKDQHILQLQRKLQHFKDLAASL